ncbi:MAG: ATP-dependent DNA helicase [Bacillota bacterium]|nr:ATP-dependent DNA helicase [Bacillota bacterium]
MKDLEKNKIKISVRNLVEFIMRSGDIDSKFMGSSRALEGTKAHQKIQKENKDKDKGYISEVSLKYPLEYKGFNFIIEGRADGIISSADIITIDEIKTTSRPLEYIDENYNETHWSQAKCYAFIYCEQNNLDQIGIQLTYYQIETYEIKRFIKIINYDEIRESFYCLIDKYLIWASVTSDWINKRDDSIKELKFPFEKYRKGQRELAVSVYKTIVQNKKIFIQAPTGIGKTISTLFPTIKAIAEGHTSKIFYLTSKTIIRDVAEEAFIKMKEKGLEFKTITLTAKDKICFKEKSICNPEYCEFAKGHFDRVNNAILDLIQQENYFTRSVIESYSRKHKICPFEFSLDLTLWADCVICDYNYVFDPRVYLKRFFTDNSGEFTFLIDEAHNLVDRAREMFSAEIYKKPVLELKKLLKDKEPRIAKSLNKINQFMISMKKQCNDDSYYVQENEPKDIYPLINQFISESEEWLVRNEESELHEKMLEMYFSVLTFMRIAELYDERYITYVENSKDDTKIKLFCLDPSYLLSEAVKRGKSAVFFSATLMPIDYFSDILGGGKDSYTIRLSSPFDIENRAILIADNISTKYNNRDKTYSIIADYIKVVLEQKHGNYIVFFPSYKYMNEVYTVFIDRYPDINTTIQSNNMTEEERDKFLESFKQNINDRILGFCVLGGLFSEGIDLKHDRLIGAIVVGVGLPQICFERNIIKDYFNKKNNSGYEYSYMYPGMNKVLQAAGRVIRTETDRGIILLIDERFTSKSYMQLFPKEWFPSFRVGNMMMLKKQLREFWK